MWLFLALIWFFSGLLTGITSFGGNMVAIPLLALISFPRDAILLGCISGWAMCLVITLLYCKSIVWRDLALLIMVFLAGMPVGLLFLKFASEKAPMLTAGLLVMGFLGWQWLAPRLSASPRRGGVWQATCLGFLSGVMLGAMGMGGPPIAFYALSRDWSKNETLATLNALFVILYRLWPACSGSRVCLQ